MSDFKFTSLSPTSVFETGTTVGSFPEGLVKAEGAKLLISGLARHICLSPVVLAEVLLFKKRTNSIEYIIPRMASNVNYVF